MAPRRMRECAEHRLGIGEIARCRRRRGQFVTHTLGGGRSISSYSGNSISSQIAPIGSQTAITAGKWWARSIALALRHSNDESGDFENRVDVDRCVEIETTVVARPQSAEEGVAKCIGGEQTVEVTAVSAAVG